MYMAGFRRSALPDVEAADARPMIMRWISEVPSKIVKLSDVAPAEQRAC